MLERRAESRRYPVQQKGLKTVKLTFRVTNRAILRSGEDIQGNRWTIDCEVGDLSHDLRRPLADRLFEDTFVCEGVLNDSGSVEPRLGEYGEPVLLQVDGTGLQDLVAAIRRDQSEVEEYLAETQSEKNLIQA